MSFPYSVQYEDLTEWIQQYTASEVEEIHSAACTIRHWRGYIQNSWKYGKSNGLSEVFFVKYFSLLSAGIMHPYA